MALRLIQPSTRSGLGNSIYLRRNNILFSEEFIQENDLENHEGADIYVDVKAKILAVDFKEKMGSASYKLMRVKENSVRKISARKILDILNISVEKQIELSYSFEANYEGLKGVFILDVSPAFKKTVELSANKNKDENASANESQA